MLKLWNYFEIKENISKDKNVSEFRYSNILKLIAQDQVVKGEFAKIFYKKDKHIFVIT